MRKLRLGVAGLGFGAAVHVPAFRAVPGIEVVAIAGSTLSRARAVADRLGIAHPCDGLADLLQRDLDIITLALPPQGNAQALDLALTQGLDVLVEKPVAADAAAAATLAARVGEHITGVDFIFAELATFQALRQMIRDGALGDVRDVALEWQVHSYAHKNRIWSWKTDARRGGGVMTAMGAHALYLAEWLFGQVAVAHARLDNAATAAFTPAGEAAAADSAAIRLVLANGAPVEMSMSNAGDGPLHRWTVRGTRGTVILENTGADYAADFRLLKGGVEMAREAFGAGDSRLEAFAPLARRFVQAVRDRASFAPDLTSGARVQALMAEVGAFP